MFYQKKKSSKPSDGSRKLTNQPRISFNKNVINHSFSTTKLQIVGCINKSALHKIISMSISMLYFCQIFGNNDTSRCDKFS